MENLLSTLSEYPFWLYFMITTCSVWVFCLANNHLYYSGFISKTLSTVAVIALVFAYIMGPVFLGKICSGYAVLGILGFFIHVFAAAYVEVQLEEHFLDDRPYFIRIILSLLLLSIVIICCIARGRGTMHIDVESIRQAMENLEYVQ